MSVLSKLIPPGVILTLLAGCSLATTHAFYDAPADAAWPKSSADQSHRPVSPDSKPVSEVPWREYFDDQRLRLVIGMAVTNNRDLRASVLNIKKARALVDLDNAPLLPNVSAEMIQQNSQAFNVTLGNAGRSPGRQLNVGLTLAAYEVDLFGRIRGNVEAGLHTWLGTEEARRTQQIMLVAEVANAWLTLSANRQRLRLARQTLINQQATLNLIKQLLDAGAGNSSDVHHAQISVESARDEVAVYVTQVAVDHSALTLLVGSPLPPSVLQNEEVDTFMSLPTIPGGLPSDLLRNRPDVQQAERALRTAEAHIGIARTDFLPTISLTAAGGIASDDLANILRDGGRTWTASPRVHVPLLDSGARRAQVQAAETDRDICLAQYERTMQVAFQEVADALAVRNTTEQRLDSLRAQVIAAESSFEISDARYRTGIDTYLAALLSQRALYAAKQGLISSRLNQLSNAVMLYKVLGGG